MKNPFILFIIFLFIFSACTNTSKTEETPESLTAQLFNFYGDTIDEKNALTIDKFLATIDSNGMDSVKLLTKINSCCQKKGCWMNVDLGNGREMKVTFKDYAFFVPMDAEKKETIISGRAYYDTISVDMLQHYAEDAGKTKEEIAAITEPKLELSFEANGLLIRK